MTDPDVVLEGRFNPDQERVYAHVPFAVPPGIRQLEVRYDYSDRIPSDPGLRGGNTLDLGLFDERGTAGSGPGFRGWSGSAAREIVVGEAWATPPYRPGPIGAGDWHALLGPYKVGPRGLEYRVEIRFDPARTGRPRPPEPRPPTRPDLPPARPGWVRADLHSHSRYSDGDAWPGELLVAAAGAGLDVLGITDHNAAVPPEMPAGAAGLGLPLLVPGVEVTTYGGHWNAWGGAGWYDFREPTSTATGAAMRRAMADGAFVAVNHPKPLGPEWAYGDAAGFLAVEVWNGHWPALNAIALAWWEDRLRRGQRPVAIGGSDTHFLHRPGGGPLPLARLGVPTTWIEVPGGAPTVDGVLAGLRAGRCFVSAGPSGPQLYADGVAEAGGVRLRVVDAAGAALTVHDQRRCVFAAAVPDPDWAVAVPFPDGAIYLRAQVADPYGTLLALTNPVWRAAGGGA